MNVSLAAPAGFLPDRAGLPAYPLWPIAPEWPYLSRRCGIACDGCAIADRALWRIALPMGGLRRLACADCAAALVARNGWLYVHDPIAPAPAAPAPFIAYIAPAPPLPDPFRMPAALQDYFGRPVPFVAPAPDDAPAMDGLWALDDPAIGLDALDRAAAAAVDELPDDGQWLDVAAALRVMGLC